MNQPSKPFMIKVPGRVNLLGEHTDYNGLPVLPIAIDKSITIKAECLDKPEISVVSQGEEVHFELDSTGVPHEQGHWANYVKAGVLGVLKNYGDAIKVGCVMELESNLPQEKGLSSSSALVVASAMTLLHANGITYDRLELAEQMADAEYFVGSRGGGMDQATCLLGEEGSLLKIDFFPLQVTPIQIPEKVSIVVCDSMVRAKKSKQTIGAYNMRACECRLGTSILRRVIEQHDPSKSLNRIGELYRSPWSLSHDTVSILLGEHVKDHYTFDELSEAVGKERIVTSMLNAHGFTDESKYASMIFACGKRLRHVINDGHRVERSVTLAQEGRFKTLGHFMNQGHESIRDDFEASSPELDILVHLALAHGALGSRLTGAGFGGCTVNLVRSENAEAFCIDMFDQYHLRLVPLPIVAMEDVVFNTRPAQGAKVITNL